MSTTRRSVREVPPPPARPRPRPRWPWALAKRRFVDTKGHVGISFCPVSDFLTCCHLFCGQCSSYGRRQWERRQAPRRATCPPRWPWRPALPAEHTKLPSAARVLVGGGAAAATCAPPVECADKYRHPCAPTHPPPAAAPFTGTLSAASRSVASSPNSQGGVAGVAAFGHTVPK